MYEKEKLLAKALFKETFKENAENIVPLADSGSNRKYFRLKNENRKVIAAINSDLKENKAYFYLTEHFRKHFLNVPEILAKKTNFGIYLLEDLGNTTLYSLLPENKEDFSEDLIMNYKQAIHELIRFQVVAHKDLDYSVCYPRESFDKQSMQWDLNYFKYYYLKLAYVPFEEQLLENDFQTLISFLKQAPADYFMYRDFQSRNIMIHEDQTWFIDFQGGRKGPLQYDLASLLFQAKAKIPHKIRESLLQYYIEQLQKIIEIDTNSFTNLYYGFVLIRTLQVLGAYGYRGYFEKKPHFLSSIRYALENLRWFLDNNKLTIDIPHLNLILEKMSQADDKKSKVEKLAKLKVKINSFSYKITGIPKDESEHGGGFVFDCRSLPNPGRLEEYKILNGLNEPVKNYLQKHTEVNEYLSNVFEIIDRAVEKYLDRNFEHLMVNFGCTGGQHRSVFCAERLKEHLEKKYKIKIEISHMARTHWQ